MRRVEGTHVHLRRWLTSFAMHTLLRSDQGAQCRNSERRSTRPPCETDYWGRPRSKFTHSHITLRKKISNDGVRIGREDIPRGGVMCIMMRGPLQQAHLLSEAVGVCESDLLSFARGLPRYATMRARSMRESQGSFCRGAGTYKALQPVVLAVPSETIWRALSIAIEC